MILQDYLKENVNKDPNGLFLISGQEQYTYSQFYKEVKGYASGLKELGIEKGDRVGLMLPNIPEWPIAYCALLSIGAIVVPLNIMLKENELRNQISDCKAKAVIFWCAFSNLILKAAAGGDCNILIQCRGEKIQGINDFPDLKLNANGSNGSVSVTDDDTCSIIYTSGTTCTVLGAELTHGNIIKNAESCSKLLPLDRSEVIIGVIPLFHSFGHTAILNLAVILGATIVLVEKFEPYHISQLIKSHSPSLFFGVPSMYHAILNDDRVSRSTFENVKYCISGAAQLDTNLLEEFENKYNCLILEGYGLTEAGPVVSFNRNASLRRKGSIVLPIDGVEIKLVDNEGEKVSQGDIGELLVRGSSIMKGYWGKHEESNSRLVGGWLCTGDLARMDDEGYYYVVDRKTDMIIKHGFNVYPEDIEIELRSNPEIIECSVIGIPNAAVGEKNKAFVVSKKESTSTEEDVRRYCEERMASYKVPDIVEFVAELPRNASGKVLKKSLRMLHEN